MFTLYVFVSSPTPPPPPIHKLSLYKLNGPAARQLLERIRKDLPRIMKKWVETFVGCACPGLKLNDVDVSFTREFRELKSEPERLVAELINGLKPANGKNKLSS